MEEFFLCVYCDGDAFWDYDADCLGANLGWNDAVYPNDARSFTC